MIPVPAFDERRLAGVVRGIELRLEAQCDGSWRRDRAHDRTVRVGDRSQLRRPVVVHDDARRRERAHRRPGRADVDTDGRHAEREVSRVRRGGIGLHGEREPARLVDEREGGRNGVPGRVGARDHFGR